MLKTRSLIIILDSIRSTHNVGSIIRTSEALGADTIVYGGYTPFPEQENDTRIKHLRDKIHTQIIKTSLGAERYISHQVSKNLLDYISNLKKQGYEIISVEQSKRSIYLADFSSKKNKHAIIFGNEVKGVSLELLEVSDQIVEIEQLGKKESLNVVQAAAIVIYKILNN